MQKFILREAIIFYFSFSGRPEGVLNGQVYSSIAGCLAQLKEEGVAKGSVGAFFYIDFKSTKVYYIHGIALSLKGGVYAAFPHGIELGASFIQARFGLLFLYGQSFFCKF